MNCSFCNAPLDEPVTEYSINRFKVALCMDHQHWFKKALFEENNTMYALQLYVRLKDLGANPYLNKKDRFKTVDIAIQAAKMHIEVDGVHHNTNSNQAITDLKRTYHDILNDIITIRIPNSLVRDNLFECADYLMRMVDMRRGYSIVNRSHKRQPF